MELMKSWSPVDLYVGGAEHTVLHLLYSRFLTKVLFDAGYIDFDEPFLKLRHQGIIMGPDHRKMSKRWGNVINPLDVISQYGADTLRMYEMFMGPLDQMKAWQVESVSGVYRFLCRVWSLSETVLDTKSPETHKDILVSLHKTIKKVDSDVTELKFNTAIAMMMEHINIWEKVGAAHCSVSDLQKFLILLAPFAPFITEELWSMLGAQKSIHLEHYPEYDPALLVADEIEVPVQVNGKVRDTLLVPAAEAQDESSVVARALSSEKVQKFLSGTPKKVIFVAGRIVNLIG
jgi:leucyl-tRNA synthetase